MRVCDECVCKPVCGKYKATGGVKVCKYSVRIVQCKNCKKDWCYLRQELGENGFCSAGERKNENDRLQ